MNLKDWIHAEACRGKALGASNREDYWHEFEAAREVWDVRFAKKIRSAFRAELRDVQAAGNESGVTVQRWADLIPQLYREVGASFAKRFDSGHKPKAWACIARKDVADLWFDAIEDYIAKYVAGKVVQIVATTQDLIKEVIRKGIDEGEGVYEISKRIDELYLEHIIPNRSEVIARTEVMSASNAGTQAAAKALGLPLTKTWLATPDSRTRDWHASADGQTREMDEPYIVNGEPLMFPGDGSLGASANNIIQCRCVETYETVKE